MVQQNEKKAMTFEDIGPGEGPVRHNILSKRLWLPQRSQIIVILVICAGAALCTNTTEAASTPAPTANLDEGVIYFIEVIVDVNGANNDDQDIINWLLPVVQNELQTCGLLVHTTSSPTISPSTFTTSSPTISQSTFIASTTTSSTLEINTTDPGTTSPTTTEATAITSIINSPTASTSNPSTTQSITSSPANSVATTLAISAITATTSTSDITTLTTNTPSFTSPTISSTTATTLNSTTQTSSLRKKRTNNPNPNANKSVRMAREISEKATEIFKDFTASCVNQTTTRKVCFITLTVTERVNPCCILQSLCAASKLSKNITVTGKRAERAGILQSNDTQCSNPSEDLCIYQGPTGPTCTESGTAYSMSSSNLTQCENKCNCSTYCSATDAYYSFNITTENPLMNELELTNLLSAIPSASECTPGSCATFPLPDISSKYKSSSITCNKELSLNCTVIVAFSEEAPICVLSDLLASLLKSLAINMTGPLTRAAICGNTVENVLQFAHKLVDVNLNSDQFCTVTKEKPLFGCQLGETVIAMMNEQCGLGTTTTTTTPNMTMTISPNMTTTISPNMTTTSFPNMTMTSFPNMTMTVTSLSANTTQSANETTTVTTNTSSTSANQNTTLATTTAGDSLATADALLEMTKDASLLNSSQVDQLVSMLENLLSGPNVSMALGNVSVQIVSNLLSASPEAVKNSDDRIIGIVDTVGLKLIIDKTGESLLSDDLALAVKGANGINFDNTQFFIFAPNNVQFGSPRVKRAVRETSSVPQGSITLPPSLTQNLTAEQQQMVSRVQFNFYQKSTLFQDKSMGDRILNSGIIGASVSNMTISDLQDDVIISLRNIQPVPANYVATCVFWDFSMNDRSGGWNSTGCKVQNVTDDETICGCNHLTNFGILLGLSREPITSRTQATILTFITYIGCGISAIFLAITLLTYLAFGKLRKDIPSKILIQLCFALLLLNLVFLVDAWLALYPDAVGLCISTAWFLHYFLLVAFSWMGLEAVHMYIALVKVFNSHISHYMLKFSLAGWGIPMIVVIIVIAIDKDNYGLVSYGKFSDGSTDEFCWIKNDVAFYVAVVAYFCVIFLFNMVMFIVVLVQLRRLKKQNPHNLQHRTTLQDVRSVLGITILLGLAWGFAFFAWGPLNLPFMYLFAIFNSLQGFFIFIFHCAVKENVRRQWRTYLCCGHMRLAENSEWSRTATQKTMKKSSVTRITSLHSSKSNNSSNSSSYLVSESSEQMNGFGSPFSDAITADEDPSTDVILNELNSHYRRL